MKTATSTHDVIIVNTGVSNLFNVRRAFESLGARILITDSTEEISAAPRLVLPGVGAFREGMKNLEEMGLVQPIRSFARSGKPLLGICLGMQLLMSRSHEFGSWDGLDLIGGEVEPLHKPDACDCGYKIPHIGWSRLERHGVSANEEGQWGGTLLGGLGRDPYVYFVHSYAVYPSDQGNWLATTSYGRDRFCSVVRDGNVYGCQFHPERSGVVGIKILEEFLSM